MSPGASIAPFERIVGCIRRSSGSLVVSIGGMHGNEPAGVIASRRVIEQLGDSGVPFRGEYLALAGNLAALETGCRFIDEDLNRIWFPDRLMTEPPSGGSQESLELQRLYEEIGVALGRSAGPTFFLDLHTTSAGGAPFSVFADTLGNRRLAQALPAPMVLGLEEHLEGTLLNYVNELGYVAVGFEGGQHESPAAVDAHELAIWRTLDIAGCVRASDIPGFDRLVREVEDRTRSLPSVVEIRHRHEVEAGQEFVMMPGFRNLQYLEVGTLLARDRRGEIHAAERGRILMPLYQSQGSDGFFMVRDVRQIWLTLSAWMRRLSLDRWLAYLPGVRPKLGCDDTYLVDPAVARWLVVQVFHLLGFRRRSPEAGSLVFTRRRETVSESGARAAG